MEVIGPQRSIHVKVDNERFSIKHLWEVRKGKRQFHTGQPILQRLIFDAIGLGPGAHYTRRQNEGKNRTKTLNTSTLPSIISHTNSSFAP